MEELKSYKNKLKSALYPNISLPLLKFASEILVNN